MDPEMTLTWLEETTLLGEDATARYFRDQSNAFPEMMRRGKAEGRVLVAIIAVAGFGGAEEANLLYVLEDPASPRFEVIVRPAANPVSVATVFPSASLFEREISDGFGIPFRDAFDTRRLFLHEMYPDGFHPLARSKKTRDAGEGRSAPFGFREITGSSVYQVPVGPVHAGIIEPGHFRFSVIGEEIVNLEIRLGYLHRGIEKLAEGKDPLGILRLAEAVSGDESVVNATGCCMALEQIAGIAIPSRAEYIRGILLELERSYSLISDLAGMLTDIAHPVSSSALIMLREELQREADRLTGSRFMKGFITPGGVREDVTPSLLDNLFKTAGTVERDLQKIVEAVLAVPSVIDRFATTGIIRQEIVDPLALSGPVARASGSGRDTRVDHPYGIYLQRPPVQVYEPGGDVMARFTLKFQEITASLRYIQELILFIPEGEIQSDFTIRDGFALVSLEGARGMTLHFIHIFGGRVNRYKIRTASFCNWYALEHAVMNNIVPDFPVINKSLNLSYAGTDL